MRYELFYLIGASKEADTDKIKADIRKLVEEAGGIFEEKETQEKRKLAYKVAHESHGLYIAQRFELAPEKLGELNGKLNLNNAILRFILSRADELPELKSKEERITEALKTESAGKVRNEERIKESTLKKTKEAVATTDSAPVKQPEKEKELEDAPENKKETAEEKETIEKTRDEDIDKKLEEILNI